MNFALMIPELTALMVLLVLLLGELFIKDFSQKRSADASTAGALAVLGALALSSQNQGSTFHGTFAVNSLSIFFKVFFAVCLIPVIQMAREFFSVRLRSPGEFFLTLWITLIGLFFLSSAHDFLLLFIALEIVTLSFYIMASYLKKDLFSIEAGLKYLILGSLASAFMIYGVSLLYVAAGTTSFTGIREVFAAGNAPALMTFGLLLILSGIAFKAAAVPFQLWAADVYEGAPTPVTAFLSSGSKAAAFLLFLNVLYAVFPGYDSGRVILFSALSAMTLIYGNLGALAQTNIKRLFAYSGISHAGYLLMGLASGGIRGTEALLFYLIAYSASTLSAFLVMTVVGQALGSDRIDSYRGLARRSPFLAAVFFVSLLSLAGIPPLAGFFGKFLILLSAVHEGHKALAFLGCLAVAVSLFYYLNLVRKVYADEPSTTAPVLVSPLSKLILSVLTAFIILSGFWQAPILSFASYAAKSLF